MFNQLTGIFDRNFTLAFYVPALILMGATWLMRSLPLTSTLWDTVAKIDLTQTTIFVIVTWFVALLLYAFNTPVYRLLEGYWPWGLQRWLAVFQLRRFRRYRRRLEKLADQQQRSDAGKKTFIRQEEKTQLELKLAERFPSREDLILPTGFGNVLRAFEDYSFHLYGFEAVKGWSRLHAVLPKDFRELIDSNQAGCDMWVSLWVVSVALSVESLLLIHGRIHYVVCAACLTLAWFCVWRACSAAIDWGDWVKAAFDAYLPKLCKQLGFDLPQTSEEIYQFWFAFSAVIVFNRKEWLKSMDDYRAKPSSGANGKENDELSHGGD